MEETRKITVEVPARLLERAQQETGKGVTQTVRAGLERLAAAAAYEGLLKLRGKVRFSKTFQELKYDR